VLKVRPHPEHPEHPEHRHDRLNPVRTFL
jgi:hypothetical protein